MKDQHKERWRAWAERAEALLEEIRRCRGYKEIEEDLNIRMEEIYLEHIRLMREGIKILPGREKLKMAGKILKAIYDNKVYRMKWTLLKLGRLMLGMDV